VLADLPGVLDDCEEGARRTTQIVSELRSFARGDERGWHPTDLHRGIASTLRLLAPQLKPPIIVHRDFDDLPDVECLPGQMNQVFLNLLANAADAIGRRAGTIWISTRRASDSQVSIAIRDDGPGMAPEIQARVFEPFFTTKGVGQGTGLGLSVSYGIVQRHRGTLTVESAPGAGATFTIMLPVKRATLTCDK
jgi:two-component system NtrC family sensor kinase